MSEVPGGAEQHLVVACAWCRAVLSPARNDGSDRLRTSVGVTHTICPICRVRYFRHLLAQPAAQTLSEQRIAVCESPSADRDLRASRRRIVGKRAAIVILVAVVGGFSAGCGARRWPQAMWTMPSPDGCYARIWDRRAFNGTSEFINGPRRYNDLRDLPGRTDWSERIRSLWLGSQASVIAWSEEQFHGKQLLLRADSPEQEGFATVAMKIRSLEIRCSAQSTN